MFLRYHTDYLYSKDAVVRGVNVVESATRDYHSRIVQQSQNQKLHEMNSYSLQSLIVILKNYSNVHSRCLHFINKQCMHAHKLCEWLLGAEGNENWKSEIEDTVHEIRPYPLSTASHYQRPQKINHKAFKPSKRLSPVPQTISEEHYNREPTAALSFRGRDATGPIAHSYVAPTTRRVPYTLAPEWTSLHGMNEHHAVKVCKDPYIFFQGLIHSANSVTGGGGGQI